MGMAQNKYNKMIEKNSSFVGFVREVEEKVVFGELTKLFDEMHGIKTHRI